MAASANRRVAEATAHWCYQKKFSWFKDCVYCGMKARAFDHVFPLSLAANLELNRPGVRKTLGQGLNLVPSCTECNSLAGRRPFVSIKAKRDFIQAKLRKRLSNDLAQQDWPDDELKELGHTLRVTILKGVRARLRAEMRCNWPHARDGQGRRIR